MKTINKHKAKELIKNSKGLIFAATFTKKDGTHRSVKQAEKHHTRQKITI